MTIGGWITMFISVGSVTAFFGWTLYRVLTTEPAPEELHSIKDKTPDIDEY